MRIVVSGASGLIGSALVPALEAAGHDVLRLVRRKPRPGEVEWDPAAGTIDTRGLVGVDAVVNMSGAPIDRRWTPSRKGEIRASRVATTALLARTIAALEPRPSVLVCAGGIDIYGVRGDEILTEDSELGGGSFLAEVGREWEEAAEPARAEGIRVVNFRQAMVLSKAGGAIKRMLPFFKLGVGGRVASGQQWWSWVAIDDVVSAYEFVLGHDLAGPVILASPNPVTCTQFVRALGHATHRPTVFPAPAFAIRLLYGEMGESALIHTQRALPARLLESGFAFAYEDLEQALRHVLAT